MRRTWTIFPALALCVALAGGPADAAQRKFHSPQEAVDALVKAVRVNDRTALMAILGAEGRDIVASGDENEDAARRNKFVAAYDEHSKLDQINPYKTMLDVGNDNWQFPIPLVKSKAGWRFDTAAGRNELLARRIGQNEMAAIQASLAYVDAQKEYASEDRGDGVLDYAQRFRSTPGKHDGLYWETAGNEPESPLGPGFAKARAEGYFGNADPNSGPQPFHGYYFKILTGQGADAKGGAYNYMVGNRMIGGYAMVAYPASYRVSGVTTFIVNQDGVVYQQDLGPKTSEIASRMTVFNPGPGWTKAPQN
ncbi:MAG TPA: DUF2950 domain-containing protein [Rhizomicrobium sp.]|nr:DUF2950 domain-containing protein [Rhizomicrobium sp.]